MKHTCNKQFIVFQLSIRHMTMTSLIVIVLKKNTMAEEESDKKWTHERKLLLLKIRLSHEGEFCSKKKKRFALWGEVLRDIKEIDAEFPFSRDDISRKFMNFMVTYKRIKRRNNTTGEAATTWEFFDQLDEVYGTRADIVVPEEDLHSPLSDTLSGTNEHSAEDDNSGTDKNPPRKRTRCDVLDFLRSESHQDKKLLKALLDCEKEKLKVEREKIEEIRKLREVLSNSWTKSVTSTQCNCQHDAQFAETVIKCEENVSYFDNS